jgi:hypothetical protein
VNITAFPALAAILLTGVVVALFFPWATLLPLPAVTSRYQPLSLSGAVQATRRVGVVRSDGGGAPARAGA